MPGSPLRVIYSPAADGAWNMAVDEALVDSAAHRGHATLRFYQWRPATLSLGYFQRASERQRHPASGDCPLVRRASGGGAIVHDQELTYSLAVPQDHPLAADAPALYRRVHQTLIDVFHTHSVRANFCMGAGPESAAEQPFLCFQRRSPGDLLLKGEKIVGSAQRRRRGAILQHGSILLATSAWAPELPGIRDITGVDFDANTLAAAMVTQIAQTWQIEPKRSEITAEEAALAERFVTERYGHRRWSLLR